MKILFVASECAPFAKSGGLGDVLWSLPRALKSEGAEVAVMLPKYSQIPEKYKELRPSPPSTPVSEYVISLFSRYRVYVRVVLANNLGAIR